MTALRSIAVLGAGVAAWCAAAAFARRLPGVSVAVIEDRQAAPHMADLFGGATPSATVFHHDIGIDEADLLSRTGALYRLGTRFEGWVDGLPAYTHAYGQHGRQIDAAGFHQHWLSLRHEAGAFGQYSIACLLAEEGRFALPGDCDAYGVGLSLDPSRYRDYVRAYALHLGATSLPGRLTGMVRDEAQGHVRAVVLEDGRHMQADLFVDSDGTLAGIISPSWVDWERWLPCDQAVIAFGPQAAEPPVCDHVAATADGWLMTASQSDRTMYAHVHRAASQQAEMALSALCAHAVGTKRYRQGRRATPWSGNVVAIGDAAVCVEPLEATNLHLVHAHVDRIVAALPGRDMNPVELADYNRQSAEEADRLRDFLVLHYATSRRQELFWRDVASATPPDSLAGDLALFAERGRLRTHDGDTFDRDNWLSVLLGQGVYPRRRDPLAYAVTSAQRRAMLADMRVHVRQAAARAPTHRAALARLAEARA